MVIAKPIFLQALLVQLPLWTYDLTIEGSPDQ